MFETNSSMAEKIIILDFGSQVTQLIGRRLRELNVYCEIYPFNKVPSMDGDVKGVILSGSPCSVRDAKAPQIDLSGIKIRACDAGCQGYGISSVPRSNTSLPGLDVTR